MAALLDYFGVPISAFIWQTDAMVQKPFGKMGHLATLESTCLT